MVIFISIALGWLALATLFALVCRMAATGDRVPSPEIHEDAGSAAEELLLWEGLAGLALRDLRPSAPACTGAPQQQLSAHLG